MSSQRLIVGLIALITLWLAGFGIDRLVSGRIRPEAGTATRIATEASEPPSHPNFVQPPTPVASSTILGSRMADIDQLLRDWKRSEHGAGPGYFKYDRDVRLVIHYRNGTAVGVAVLSLGNEPISGARGAELTRLVGAAPDDANYLNGELHEIYYGDI